MSEPIRSLFDKTLHGQGFKKTSGSWYSDRPETVLVANLQDSQHGNSDYINLGVWPKAIGEAAAPKEHHCHVRIRLETVAGERFREALDLDRPAMDEERRRMIIVTGIIDEATPWLEACSSLDGIRKMLHEGRLSKAMVHKEIRNRAGNLQERLALDPRRWNLSGYSCPAP